MEVRRPRVLVVGHSYVIGMNQRKLDAVAALERVDLALLVPSGWKVREWNRRLPLERWFTSFALYPARVWLEGQSGGYVYPASALFRAILGFRPDLIHVEQEVFALSAAQLALIARATHVPLVVFGWENVDRPLVFPRRLGRCLVLRTTHLFIGGNREAVELVRHWGYRGPATVLPQFGVDLAAFRPRNCRSDGGPFVVGFVGRLVWEKGVDVLLDAVHWLGRRGYACRLLVCGSGPERERLERRVHELGIADLVEWQPAVAPDQVPEVMRRLDALVLPSRSTSRWQEQFGRVLIEAMASGVPVVGSTCGEIPNVIGRDDLVFPEGDAEALARILERLLRDRGCWEEVRAYGLARVREHFTMERIAERLVELWLGVLSRDGRRES
ncbi:MAG: glycosyltransferase family 4 protein [Thermomicrobium sp.]|nr:glycosyltransferase family 4 protein [Thermomicrobium sp.]